MLPVARNSVFSSVLGISWEGMILYHTYLGGLFMIIVFVHAMLFLKVIDDAGFLPSDILAVPMQFHGDNFTIPLAMVTGLGMTIFMGIGAQWYVRRNYHEIFYWAHHFSMVCKRSNIYRTFFSIYAYSCTHPPTHTHTHTQMLFLLNYVIRNVFMSHKCNRW